MGQNERKTCQPPPKTETEKIDEWKINDDDYQRHQTTTTYSKFWNVFFLGVRTAMVEMGGICSPASHIFNPNLSTE